MFFGKWSPKMAGRSSYWPTLKALSPYFEGNEPFFYQISLGVLNIPFICHAGLENWSSYSQSTSKNVKKSKKLEKSTFLTLKSRYRYKMVKKGVKNPNQRKRPLGGGGTPPFR